MINQLLYFMKAQYRIFGARDLYPELKLTLIFGVKGPESGKLSTNPQGSDQFDKPYQGRKGPLTFKIKNSGLYRAKLCVLTPQSNRGVTFHFQHKTISKGKNFTLIKDGLTPASGHQHYIERLSAAEHSNPEIKTALLTQPTRDDEQPSPMLHDCFAHPQRHVDPQRISFGTTGSTKAKRKEFWRDIESAEARRARVQSRLIIELPFELPAIKRAALTRDFCAIASAVEFGASAEEDRDQPFATSNDATLTTSDIEDAVGILHDFVEESEKAEPYHVIEKIDGIQWEIIEQDDEPGPQSANTDHDTFGDSHGNLSTSREFIYDAEEDFLCSEEARWEMEQEINYPPEKGADDRLESVVTGVASSTNDTPTTENHVPKIYTIADFPGTYPFPFSSENEAQRRLDAEHDWNTLTNTEIFRLVREKKFAAALCKGTAFHNELFNGTKLLSFEARRRGLDLETGKHDPKMATDPARATLFTDEELVTVDPTRKSKTRQRRDDFEL